MLTRAGSGIGLGRHGYISACMDLHRRFQGRIVLYSTVKASDLTLMNDCRELRRRRITHRIRSYVASPVPRFSPPFDSTRSTNPGDEGRVDRSSG